MVNCLAQLLGILSKSLIISNGHAFPSTAEGRPKAPPASPHMNCHHQPEQVNVACTVDDIQQESNTIGIEQTQGPRLLLDSGGHQR